MNELRELEELINSNEWPIDLPMLKVHITTLLAANRELHEKVANAQAFEILAQARCNELEAANREQKEEIERLKDKVANAEAFEILAQAEVASLRASVDEKWIDVKQELPPANKNHCWLAWITSQNKNGGYIDLVSYGEYICFNEECHEGDANYVEHDDGNMKRDGWYREEETHGGEFDYIFVDLNDKVTHWQPLPVAPTLPGEEK